MATSNDTTKGKHKMERDNLYLNSEFAEWLKQCPANVDHNYDETNVDLYGTRVQICFSIED